MHQTLHLRGGHLHEEAVALHAADHTGEGLTHQRFGLAGLGHRQGIGLQVCGEAAAAVEAMQQRCAAALLEGLDLAGGHQRPIDQAVAAVTGDVHPRFVAYRRPVFAFAQQQAEHVLVPEIGVVQAGATPGSQGHRFASQGVGAGLAREGDGLERLPQLLLQHPAAIAAGKGLGQLLGGGVAIGGELQGDLQGQGRLGYIVERLRIGGGVHREDRGQLQRCEVAAEGAMGGQHQFAQQAGGLGSGIKLYQPTLAAFVRFGNGQIGQIVDGGHRQIEINRAAGQALLTQQLGQLDQLLQQWQLIFEGLERGRGGAGFGFAFGQRLQCLGIHHGIHPNGAAAEAVMLQAALRVELQHHRERGFTAAWLEGCGFGEGGWQQGQPTAAEAESFRLLSQMQIECAGEAKPFGHGWGVHPKAVTRFAAFQGHRRQDRCLGAAPGLQQQGWKRREVVSVLGLEALDRCLGGGWLVAQAVFGDQQIQVGFWPGIHRQAAGHMTLGGQLADRIAIHLHLHHRFIGGFEVLAVTVGQLNGGEQPVIEGNSEQALVLLLHLGQQAGGVALEDALHPTFG